MRERSEMHLSGLGPSPLHRCSFVNRADHTTLVASATNAATASTASTTFS
ncbi:MAG: hypothetical protein QOG15_2209 [Solirubrobacteraceae bacterium]|jgi:hypothetical protein|nr:hypothetical protein [Solirubrobacteraceae bacterium]